MVSSKLLELEDSIQTLSLEEKLWLLDKIVQQMRAMTKDADANLRQGTPESDRDAVKPIWEIAVEIGSQIPESEWEKVPIDLSKNFDLYQDSAGGK